VAEPLAEAAPAVLLLIEDEAPNRALLRAILGRTTDPRLRGATVIEAPDLATAREVLARQPVTLVLLDVRLPDGNGLTLARELRSRPPQDRPRVLILSASVLPTERESALIAGADGFLGKPYHPADLVAWLLQLIDAGPPTA
jgi:two-component system, OmpR family, KDP operon response regulator KdpE